jgi:hypothetical protein
MRAQRFLFARWCGGAMVAAWLAWCGAAAAQQALGPIAADCGSLDGQREYALSSSANVSAGNVVVVAVAARAHRIADVRIVDALGSTYQALGATRVHDSRVGVMLFSARMGSNVSSGSTWRVALRNGDSNPPVCVSITAYSDLVAGVNGQQWHAANTGFSNTPALDSGRTGDGTPELLIGAVATAGTAINVSATPPVVALPLQCDTSGSVCLATLYRTGADSGPLALDATFGTSLPWVGAMAVVDQDSLFRNGVE